MNRNRNYEPRFHATKGNVKCQFGNTGFPAVTTCTAACKYHCQCIDKCYALLNEHQYPDKMRNDWENYLLYKADPDEYFRCVREFVTENHLDTFRYFESGDGDAEFFRRAAKLANEMPWVRFYAYTKQYLIIDFINDVPVWKSKLKLMLSEWGAYKPSDELRKYYAVFKVVDLQDFPEAEREGYKSCTGDCAKCRICPDADKTVNVYSVLHGSKAIFPIPNFAKVNERLSLAENGTYRFGGKTVGGIRNAYCKANDITGYEERITALKDIWRMIVDGRLKVYKNGFRIEAVAENVAVA